MRQSSRGRSFNGSDEPAEMIVVLGGTGRPVRKRQGTSPGITRSFLPSAADIHKSRHPTYVLYGHTESRVRRCSTSFSNSRIRWISSGNCCTATH